MTYHKKKQAHTTRNTIYYKIKDSDNNELIMVKVLKSIQKLIEQRKYYICSGRSVVISVKNITLPEESYKKISLIEVYPNDIFDHIPCTGGKVTNEQ